MTTILYLAHIRLPTEKAHGLQIMKTCEALARGGAAIELVVPTRDNHLIEDPFVYYGVEQRFRVTTLRVPDFVRYGRLGFLVSALWFAEKARWLCQFWSADVIYSRDAFILAQYLLLGRTLVFEAHVKPSCVARFVAQRAHRVVVISHGLEAAYAAAGVPKDRIIIAPDAVDEHLFDDVPARGGARAALGLSINERIVLYAGHLYARKGAGTLAAAARHLNTVRIVFVGGTDDDLAAFRQVWGSAENITIVGHVSHEKIPFYLRAADVLVLPNSGHDEDAARFTSPMKLFEYMASGTPIVASDVPSLREVLNDANAYFCTPDSPEALAAGIMTAFERDTEAKTKGKMALEQAQDFSWQKRAGHILSALGMVSYRNMKKKDTKFYDTASSSYSESRYPAIARSYTQYFFKRRLALVRGAVGDLLRSVDDSLSVLEIGCADGVVLRDLSQAFGERLSPLVGIDVSPKMIEEAVRKQGDARITFLTREAYTAMERHGLILEVGVVNYASVADELAYAASHLNDDGRYILSLAGTDSLWNRLKPGDKGFNNFLSYEAYERALEILFVIEKRVPVGFFIPFLWRIPAFARVVQPIAEKVFAPIIPRAFHEQIYVLREKTVL